MKGIVFNKIHVSYTIFILDQTISKTVTNTVIPSIVRAPIKLLPNRLLLL
jgi:hypothetical protein